MPDGATFGKIAAVFIIGAVFASQFAGLCGLFGVLLGLYYLLTFFNGLARRDTQYKAKPPLPPKRRQ